MSSFDENDVKMAGDCYRHPATKNHYVNGVLGAIYSSIETMPGCDVGPMMVWMDEQLRGKGVEYRWLLSEGYYSIIAFQPGKPGFAWFSVAAMTLEKCALKAMHHFLFEAYKSQEHFKLDEVEDGEQ